MKIIVYLGRVWLLIAHYERRVCEKFPFSASNVFLFWVSKETRKDRTQGASTALYEHASSRKQTNSHINYQGLSLLFNHQLHRKEIVLPFCPKQICKSLRLWVHYDKEKSVWNRTDNRSPTDCENIDSLWIRLGLLEWLEVKFMAVKPNLLLMIIMRRENKKTLEGLCNMWKRKWIRRRR